MDIFQRATKQDKESEFKLENKSNVSLSTYGIILYVENSKDFSKMPTWPTNSAVTVYKINIQKSIVNNPKRILRKQFYLYNINKNTLLRNRLNQGGKIPVYQKLPKNAERNQGRHKYVERHPTFTGWNTE